MRRVAIHILFGLFFLALGIFDTASFALGKTQGGLPIFLCLIELVVAARFLGSAYRHHKLVKAMESDANTPAMDYSFHDDEDDAEIADAVFTDAPAEAPAEASAEARAEW